MGEGWGFKGSWELLNYINSGEGLRGYPVDSGEALTLSYSNSHTLSRV